MSETRDPAQTPASGDEHDAPSSNTQETHATSATTDGPAPGNTAPPGRASSAANTDDDEDGPMPGNEALPTAPARGLAAAQGDDEPGEADEPEDAIGNRVGAESETDGNNAAGADATSGGTPGAPGTAKRKRKRRDRRKGDRPAGVAGAEGVEGVEGAPRAEGTGGGEGRPSRAPSHANNDANRRAFHTGDKVRARIDSIGAAGALVSLWDKEEAVIDRRELLGEDGAELPVGEQVDVIVIQDGARGGNLVVTRDPEKVAHGRELVARALATGETVEGLVTGHNRGGLEVDVAGVRAFCPASQIDARFPPAVSPKMLVLTRQEFKVTQLEDDGREAIVSRRAILETEVRARATEALATMHVGDVVKGIVTSIKDYGVFVDLNGVEGLIHMMEFSHNRSLRVSDVLKVGDEVEAKILKISGGERPASEPEKPAAAETAPTPDATAASASASASEPSNESAGEAPVGEGPTDGAGATGVEPTSDATTVQAEGEAKPTGERGRKRGERDRDRKKERPKPARANDGLPRVMLSRRAVEKDPWEGFEKRYPPGSVHTGKVMRMQPFGAFVELEPGIDGLLHVSELGEGKRIEHPQEVLKDGQVLTVLVERTDRQTKRISLALLPEGVTAEQLKTATVPRVGLVAKAKIVEHDNHGVWAEIQGAIGKQGRGFIAPPDSGQPRGADLRRALPLGSIVQVKVVEVDRGRPKLSIRAAAQDEERQAYKAYQKDARSQTVGTSLADKLRAKLGNLGTGKDR